MCDLLIFFQTVSGPTPIGDHARGDPSLRRIYAPSPVFIPVFRDGCPEALAKHVPKWKKDPVNSDLHPEL